MTRGPEDERAKMDALNDALDRYRSGRLDLGSAAEEAGMSDFEFLEVAKTQPGPATAEEATDLPTFVRGRRPER